jgi:hypothetical protein
MDFRAAGGQQLGLPGRGIRAAGNHDTLAFERPEDGQFGEPVHAGRAVIPRLLQDIHR